MCSKFEPLSRGSTTRAVYSFFGSVEIHEIGCGVREFNSLMLTHHP
jgi:hypothetical protein